MPVKKYNKLIRDKIPEIIVKSGASAIVETLDDSAYKKFLDAKLGEELQEYLESGSIEELADIAEVILAILKFKGVKDKDFADIRGKKVDERGAFDKRLLLKEVVEE